MSEIIFACKPEELSCIIGNLFTEIRPPCEYARTADLTIVGTTHSGNPARLIIQKDCCLYYGPQNDLEVARNGFCPERRCEHG